MGTLKIPSWVWIAIPVIGLLAVGIRGATQASYYRGIADDAEQRLEVQEVVLDSVRSMANFLSEELARADSVAIAQRAIAEREVARLTRSREEAQERTEAISERLRMSLDSMQSVELDSLVYGYENQIQSLYSIIEVERTLTAAERLRATQASELVLSLRSVIVEHEERAAIQDSQIAALRNATSPSFGLRLKADWWLAAIGLVAGYVIAGE
jgi:F420-0:gamma-glutamyl ligase